MNRHASPAEQDEQATEPPGEGSSEPRRRAIKFMYSTGDRPLDGYTIKRGVGRGGFGEVYFATSDAGKEVALKLIRRNLDVELRGVRQCLNLKHTNLVGLYDIRTDCADDEWVVMEYVDGEPLDQIIDRHPNGMPVEQAVAWLRGIAAGVAYLHRNGIVHRDLKPGNLFLERSGADPESALQGVVKIGDYGLSKFISASRRSGQTESVGTVHYMAPEIAGGRYGREIDSYAIGVIFYEMLTGHVPFEGESVGEVLMKHLTAEPDLSRLEEPYRTIVARALAKDPESRLESVEEMIALLPGEKRAAAEEPIVLDGVQPNQTDRVWRPVTTPPHTAKAERSDEPLWQGMVSLTQGTRRRWNAWRATPLLKGLLLLGICWFAILTAPAWLSVLIGFVPIYLIYYVIWSAFLSGPPPHTPAAAVVGPNGRVVEQETVYYRHKPSQNKKPRIGWRQAAMREIRETPTRLRLRGLVGSMLFAALLTTGVASLASALMSQHMEADPVAFGVWLAVMGSLGSWAVLATNAMTEARVEDRAPMRGLQLMFGLGLGLASYSLASVLGLGMPNSPGMSPGPSDTLLREGFEINLYAGTSDRDRLVDVPLVASAAYFALVMLACRWWRLAEYTRQRRIGFWATAGCVIWAWVLSLIVWYPQPAGVLLAGTIGVAVQAASHWAPPSRRVELARGA